MKKTLVFWFTGLSGSGKTTIANEICRLLSKRNKKIKIYDGDVIRNRINKHLTFSPTDIKENNRKIAQLCSNDVANNKYDYIFVSVISPFKESRDEAKQIIGHSLYLVYCKASIEEMIKRDPKGLYKKALSGQIDNFIGIDRMVPYQRPRNADLVMDTEKETLRACVNKFVDFIELEEKIEIV